MKEVILTFHKGEVLLISGPASVSRVSGEVFCLGKVIEDEKVIVRKGKVIPFETLSENSSVKVLLAEEANYEIQKEKLGCMIWHNDVIKYLEKFGKEIRKIIIIGPIDSGKSTLTVFINNLAVLKKLKVGIIDGDIGQADLAPSCFIGYKVLDYPIYDLRDVIADGFIYVGSINVSQIENLVISSIKKSLEMIKDYDIIIINTDGYVENGGINYKLKLVNEVNPDLIFLLSQTKLNEIFKENFKEKVVELQPAIGIKKSKLIRITRREIQYSKFLVAFERINLKISEISFGLFDITFEEDIKIHNTVFSKKNKEGKILRVIRSNEEIILKNSLTNSFDITTQALKDMFIGIEKDNKIVGFGVIENIIDDRIRIRTRVKPPINRIWLCTIKVTEKGERKINYVIS